MQSNAFEHETMGIFIWLFDYSVIPNFAQFYDNLGDNLLRFCKVLSIIACSIMLHTYISTQQP